MIHVANYFPLLGTLFLGSGMLSFLCYLLYAIPSLSLCAVSLGGLANPVAVNVTFKNCVSSQCIYHTSKK